ncbi:hypothetical protein NC651_009284 [Populus alba x Populus x berolinensis]|nr:hypothetical protein NC651_009284 [Populus alba x Populus x berolinensis]
MVDTFLLVERKLTMKESRFVPFMFTRDAPRRRERNIFGYLLRDAPRRCERDIFCCKDTLLLWSC